MTYTLTSDAMIRNKTGIIIANAEIIVFPERDYLLVKAHKGCGEFLKGYSFKETIFNQDDDGRAEDITFPDGCTANFLNF